MLGTYVSIELWDHTRSEETLHTLAGVAFGRIARVASLMSFHDVASEISRLNACGHTHPLVVHEWTREVIAEAIRHGHASDGAFDIAVAPSLQRWGFLPRRHGSEAAKGTFRDIEILPDGRIFFHQPLQIDLGGIAKGYAVDKAVEFLSEQKLAGLRVEAGGDLRLGGEEKGPPAAVSLRDPRRPALSGTELPMLRPAVATSAAYFANRRHGLRRVSHLVHPRTGKPLRSNVSVSVFAESCTAADALTKAVLFAEPERVAPLLRSEKAAAVLLTGSGERVRLDLA